MARRAPSSQSRSRPDRLPEMIGDHPLGRHTGLPLIICDVCSQYRVIELVVQTEENGNQGRVFFKCPRNNPGAPGRCTFYEFQRDYLAKLVSMKKVILLPGVCGRPEEEALSPATPAAASSSNAASTDALLRLMTLVCVVMSFSAFVSFMALFK